MTNEIKCINCGKFTGIDNEKHGEWDFWVFFAFGLAWGFVLGWLL